MLRRPGRYVSKPRDFRGVPSGSRALAGDPKSHLHFKGLGARRRGRCRACGIAFKRDRLVAREETIVTGMAGRYAIALFELALEERALDAVKADLERFDALVNESADLRRLVRSPVFTSEEQTKALAAVLEAAGIGGLTGRFLQVVASNRRLL